MILKLLHEQENAKVFSIEPFGDQEEPFAMVCCLRTHPLYPSVVELDVVPMPVDLVSSNIASLWELDQQAGESLEDDDPFGDPFEDPDYFDETFPEEDFNPTLSREKIPGESLATDIDSRGYIRVRTGVADFYPLPSGQTRDLAICCLAGRGGDFLGKLVGLMRREWGLTEKECPEIDRETIETLDSLLATDQSREFCKASDLFNGCEDERTAESVGWYAGDPDLGWRSQSAREYPLLAGILASEPETREAIDGGRPLLPALKSVFPGLTKGGLKRLGQIGRQNVRQIPVCDHNATPLTDPDLLGHLHDRRFVLTGEWQVKEAIKALTEIGNPSIIPAATEEWDAFATLYGGFIRPLQVTMDIDTALAIGAGKGHWGRLLKQLSAALELPEGKLLDRHQATVLVTDLLEMCNDMARTVFLPAMTSMVRENTTLPVQRLPQQGYHFHPELGQAAFHLARNVLLQEGVKNPILHCCQLVRRWTPRINSINNIMAETEEDRIVAEALTEEQKKWERDTARSQPATEGIMINGVSFTPLCTDYKLKEEGELMDHCIHSYKKRLLEGDAVIYHLQLDGEMATLCLKPKEVGMDGEECRFYQDGLNGISNRNPHHLISEAANRFIKGLDDGQIPVREEFLRWRKWAISRTRGLRNGEDPWGVLASYCGYPRNELDLHRIDSETGMLPLTSKLWEEWRGITKCRDHPYRIIAKASSTNNPLAKLLDPECSGDTLNDMKGRVLGHDDYPETTPWSLVAGHGDQSQPTLN